MNSQQYMQMIYGQQAGQPMVSTSTVTCGIGGGMFPGQQQLQQDFYDAINKDPAAVLKPKKGASMFTEVARDVKSFILEHRAVIYFIVIALIVDHLIFKDAFRQRLQDMAGKIVDKVEAKIEK